MRGHPGGVGFTIRLLPYSTYLYPVPVSKTTTRSPRSSFPAARSFSTAIHAAPSFGRGEEPFARGHLEDAPAHLVVRHRHRLALRLAEDLQDQVVRVRLRDAQAAGVRVRVGEADGDRLARLERPRDRRAPLGLDDDHPRPRGADPAEALHLVPRLPHPDEARAAAGGIDDDVGELPAELLGDLVSHRLLPLDAVRLLQRRDVEPPLGVLPLRDDPSAVVDEAVDERHVGAVRLALDPEDLRRVARHEDVAGEARLRRVGGRGAPGVPRRRQGDGPRPERLRHRDRRAQPARLEGAGRVSGLLLDPDVPHPEPCPEPRRVEEGRPPSPSVTISSALLAGISSCQRQIVRSRPATSSAGERRKLVLGEERTAAAGRGADVEKARRLERRRALRAGEVRQERIAHAGTLAPTPPGVATAPPAIIGLPAVPARGVRP